MPVGTSCHSLGNFVRHSLVPIGLSGARWSASTEALCWHTAFATPVRVWVIQTKYRRVSKKSFSKVLSRIAANTDTVCQWVPAGMPVRGCLVLAYETEIKRRDYSHRDEKIIAYTPVLLMREMRCEARKKRSLDERITKDIWKFGAPSDLSTPTRASRRGADFLLHWGRFRSGLATLTRALADIVELPDRSRSSTTRQSASSSSTSKGYWGRPNRRENIRSASG